MCLIASRKKDALHALTPVTAQHLINSQVRQFVTGNIHKDRYHCTVDLGPQMDDKTEPQQTLCKLECTRYCMLYLKSAAHALKVFA